MKPELKRIARQAALAISMAAATLTAAHAQTEFQRHIEASHLNVGSDPTLNYPARAFYCNLPDDNNAILLAQRAKNNIRVNLTQILDDVWFLGSEYVGQYIIKTPTGFNIVDTGNNTAEATNYVVPALLSLGAGPSAPLNAIILTHGHADHDGGAAYLQSYFGAKVYIGSADYSGKAYTATTFDSSNLMPHDEVLGGQTVTVMSTPGHTSGSTSYIITAHDNGKEVKLFVTGGSSMQSSASTIVSYIDSLERAYALVKAQRPNSGMHPHAFWDGSLDLVKLIQAQGKKVPSQFVFGNERTLRMLAIARECSAAWLVEADASAVTPVWRVSGIDFMAGGAMPNRISAKLSNGWGPLVNKAVTFSVAGSSATCTATTDSSGVATCNSSLGTLTAGVDQITASYAGGVQTGYSDLASTASTTVNNGCPDLTAAKAAMGAKTGDARYAAKFDVDGNGVIDVRDIAAVTRQMTAGTICQ